MPGRLKSDSDSDSESCCFSTLLVEWLLKVCDLVAVCQAPQLLGQIYANILCYYSWHC